MTRLFPEFVRTAEQPRGRLLGDDERRIVFHHIPKTAGSTFRRILEIMFEAAEVCPGELDDEIVLEGFRMFAGHFSLFGTRRVENAQRLIFLRNPIERVISEYDSVSDWSHSPAQWRARVHACAPLGSFVKRVASMDLETYLRSDDSLIRDRITNRQVRSLLDTKAGLDLWNHADELRAVDPDDPAYFPVDDDTLLETAKKRLRDEFAFVGVQDAFELSLQVLSMTFGIRPFGDTNPFTSDLNPKHERPDRRRTRYDIDAELRQIIIDRNRLDTELWQYARSLMFERLNAFNKELRYGDAWVIGGARASTRIARSFDRAG